MLININKNLHAFNDQIRKKIRRLSESGFFASHNRKKRNQIRSLEASAREFYSQKAFDKAICELERCIQLNPRLARRAFLMKSWCLMELGRMDESLTFASLGLGYASNSHQRCQTLNQMGYLWSMIFDKSGKRSHIDLAIMLYEKAFEESSYDILPVVNLVIAHLDAASKTRKLKPGERQMFEQKAKVWMDRIQHVPLQGVSYNLKYLKLFTQNMKSKIFQSLDAAFWSKRLVDLASQVAEKESIRSGLRKHKTGFSLFRDQVLLILFLSCSVSLSLNGQTDGNPAPVADGITYDSQASPHNVQVQEIRISIKSSNIISVVIDVYDPDPRTGGIGINDLAEIEASILNDPAIKSMEDQHPNSILRITYFDLTALKTIVTRQYDF